MDQSAHADTVIDAGRRFGGSMAEIGQRSNANVSLYADATAKAVQIWMAGLEPIFKPLGEMMRVQGDENRSAWDAMCHAKSFDEARNVQTNHVRMSLHKATAEVSRINDGVSKLIKEAIAPFTAQIAVADISAQ